MNSITEANLRSAAQTYAISNTPVFLVRRLQEDPVIFDVSRGFSGQQILEALAAATAVNPKTLLEYVRPYAYLVALSKLPTDEYLRAADVARADSWRWLPYAKELLLASYKPVSVTSVVGKKGSVSASADYKTSSSNSQTTLVFGGR